jgi:hypothetical protein
VIFSGSFVGPISWNIGGTQGKFGVEYQLSGQIRGQFWDGRFVTVTTTQTIDTFKNQEIVLS